MIDGYLRRLGIEGRPEATYETLVDLHHRHLDTLPYENLSIMLAAIGATRAPDAVDPVETLERVAAGGNAGYCFHNNGVFSLALYLFFVHQATTDQPFLPLHLFRDRNFAAGLAMIGVVGVVLFATSALLPPFLQNLLGYPVLLTGLAVAPRGFGTLIAMRTVGPLARHFDARQLMAIGMLSTVAFGVASHTAWLYVARALSGFATGLAFQLPLALLGASAMGVVTSYFLPRYRKQPFLLAFVLAAVLTPSIDLMTQGILGGALYLLFELSIVLIRLTGK